MYMFEYDNPTKYQSVTEENKAVIIEQLQASCRQIKKDIMTLMVTHQSLVKNDKANRAKQSLLKRIFTPFKFSTQTTKVLKEIERLNDRLKEKQDQLQKITQ